MLPLLFERSAAISLVVGGTVGCFAGDRWFRIVLAIDGFIAGARLASSDEVTMHQALEGRREV